MSKLIKQPPFAGIRTFMGMPAVNDFDDYAVPRQIMISGICADARTTNRPGARLGPAAIRDASMTLCEIQTDRFIGDLGDFVPTGFSFDEIEGSIAQYAFWQASLSMPIFLGGDHSITLPILRSVRKAQDRPVALVMFDAHTDTWTENWGDKYSHGCWLRRAVKEGLIDPEHSSLIGIRSSMDQETWDYARRTFNHVYTAADVHTTPMAKIIDEVLRPIDDCPAYLTLDIDVLDPAFAPGTGCPEVGGLASWQIREFLRDHVISEVDWVGMDVVEVSPPYDHAQITALAAAQFVSDFIERLVND